METHSLLSRQTTFSPLAALDTLCYQTFKERQILTLTVGRPPPEFGWINSKDDEHGEVCEVIGSQGILPSSRAQTMSAAAKEIELEQTLSQRSSGPECRDLVFLTNWIRGQA